MGLRLIVRNMDPRTRHILAQVFNSPNLAMDAIGGNLADMFIPGHASSSILKKMQAAKQGPKPNYPTMDADPGGMKVPDDTTLPLLAASAPLGMIAPETRGIPKPLPGNSNIGGALAKAIKQALGRAEGELSPEALAQLRAVGPEPNPGYFPGELFNNHPTMRMPKPPQGAAAQPFELEATAVKSNPLDPGANLGEGNGLKTSGRTLQNPVGDQLDMFKGQAPKVPNDLNIIPPFKKSQGLSLDSLDNGYADTAVKPNFLEEELKSRVAKPKMSYAPKDFAQEIPMNGSEAPPFEPTKSMRVPKDLTPSPPAASLNSRGKPMVTEKNSAIAAGIAAALALPSAGYVVNQAMHRGNETPALPIGAVPGHPIEAIPLPSETPKAKASRPAKRPPTSGQPGEGPFKLDPFSGVEDMDYQNFSDMLRAGILSMKR